MAGATLFFVYDSKTRQVVDIKFTQDHADTSAAENADWTALQGGLDEGQDAGGETVDAMLAEPGRDWYIHAAEPYLRQSIVDPYPLRTGLRAWHNRLVFLGGLLQQDRIHANYPPGDIQLGQAILHNLHRGAYVVAHRATLTTPQQRQWHAMSALAPNDQVNGQPA